MLCRAFDTTTYKAAQTTQDISSVLYFAGIKYIHMSARQKELVWYTYVIHIKVSYFCRLQGLHVNITHHTLDSGNFVSGPVCYWCSCAHMCLD